ncbi:MAG TPA: DUF3307 domain-containing protein [Rhizomicrobium sp.]|nr:DUF3307 domain-containing protein [Rhizomicrobium sp.]
MTVTSVLLALLALQAKHYLCDFVLQNQWQIEAKKSYLKAGGLVHAGLHAVLSIPALLILSAQPVLLAAIPAGEFVLHYHLDWAKARIDSAGGWTQRDKAYWAVFGLDQLFHQLTYMAIVVIAAGL